MGGKSMKYEKGEIAFSLNFTWKKELPLLTKLKAKDTLTKKLKMFQSENMLKPIFLTLHFKTNSMLD